MADSNDLIAATDRLRAEVREGTAELRAEMRDGFQRLEDRQASSHGRIERHSERLRALDHKWKGIGSDGYRSTRMTLTQTPPKPVPALTQPPKESAWRGVAIAAASAVAGMVATKVFPPLVVLLAEVLK